ncbi:hypothetical protein AB0J14_00925 [Micromonospora arborensis]|uniref:hypothetical protein n=1 Tax=Micromonospora arborensis TaxID=2116518 RepID=UPI0033EC225C
MTSSNAERPTAEHVPAEELARRQGIRPIASVDDLARPDLFELDEFLADLYASRRAGAARASPSSRQAALGGASGS